MDRQYFLEVEDYLMVGIRHHLLAQVDMEYNCRWDGAVDLWADVDHSDSNSIAFCRLCIFLIS